MAIVTMDCKKLFARPNRRKIVEFIPNKLWKFAEGKFSIRKQVCWKKEMVLLHIKRGETSQFLYETTNSIEVGKLAQEIVAIYNGRLKIRRICAGLVFSWVSERIY